ncbi:sterol esterase [Ranunculus cassubicifolius]
MRNNLKFLFLVFISNGLAFCSRTEYAPMEDEVSTMVDGLCSLRVATYGYPCEEHTVTTADGYILSVQRMPSGVSNQTSGDKMPVLLQHGLLMDGVTWLYNSPDKSLAFLLADNGFDVWIANARGTRYSQGHTSLNTDDPAYWEWSWDELVTYELPAIVQYVNEETSQRLHFVGHSLGSLVALASFSQAKQVKLLRSAALLAPITHLGNVFSTLARDASEAYIAEGIYESGFHEFDINGELVTNLLDTTCKEKGLNCFDMMTSLTGQNCCLNSLNTAVLLNNEPQLSTTKNMIHISQNIPNDFPLFLSYGGADAICNRKDVKLLLNDLTNHDGDKLVVQYREDYAHADFVMAEDAKQAIYDPLITFFKLQ